MNTIRWTLQISLLGVLVSTSSAVTTPETQLRELGKAILLYEEIYGTRPERLSLLWERGLVNRFTDFLLPGSDKFIDRIAEIDTQSDFVLSDEPTQVVSLRPTDLSAPLVFKADGSIGETPGFDPRVRSVEVPSDVTRLKEGARKALAEQNAQEAERLMKEAFRLAPQIAVLHNLLGNAYYMQRKDEEALAAYRQAIVLNPQLRSAYANLAGTLYSQKQLEPALDPAIKAVQLGYRSHWVYEALGHALLKQMLADVRAGQLQEGARLLARVEQLPVETCLFHIYRGLILSKLERYQESEQAYRRALTLASAERKVTVWNNLGHALYNQARYEEAAECYREAIKQDGKQAKSYANLAGALYRLGKYDEARREAHRAMKLGHKEHWVYDKFGLKYSK